ncbi:hypothetical protein [Streptomyces sp. Je 1-332]|uniref:hypothetical protein n=1 Tax=Streptomyces sp. Je 1-332 TaxID=3231270 RepID=UPI00345A9FAE
MDRVDASFGYWAWEVPPGRPAPLRLLLGLAVFLGGAAALHAGGADGPALVLTGVLVAYHAAALDHVAWLLRH